MNHASNMKPEQNLAEPASRRMVPGLAAGLALAGLLWLGWQFQAMHTDMARIRSHDHPLGKLAGEIVHLDEVLTLSARMAAATLDPAW